MRACTASCSYPVRICVHVSCMLHASCTNTCASVPPIEIAQLKHMFGNDRTIVHWRSRESFVLPDDCAIKIHTFSACIFVVCVRLSRGECRKKMVSVINTVIISWDEEKMGECEMRNDQSVIHRLKFDEFKWYLIISTILLSRYWISITSPRQLTIITSSTLL